ncbi:putative non-LEE-encoded type III secreted effector domain protein, partial [Escherichia coli 96.0427]
MNVYRKSKKMRVISNNEMKKSIKISELVIHNIIKK